MARKAQIAFDFILDYLHPLDVRIKPMFGCHAFYVNEKIVLVTRKKDNHQEANGIWIATSPEHHASLNRQFPSFEPVSILNEGKGETNWRMIHESADDFEESAIRICELVKQGDVRIGKIPKRSMKRAK